MDFVNTVIVDASQPVQSLGKLETALDSATSAMGEFKIVADKGLGGKGFADVAKNATAAGKAGEAATKRIGSGAKNASNSIKSMGLSFKDVGRIVESQIIFASISKITQGFGEAADAAAEFQEQIARIAAIDESDLGFDGLRAEIEALAVELGRPLEEVGGAAFEALQNDLGTTSETFQILRKDAQELALVTGGDLGQAVNALSSVYKTFGRDLEEVDSVSGQFFGTINAGRITLSDLESSLGTLSPLATSIGVDFKELTDSLATITLTGTKANVATTQLRNVFNKLIKPTKALQAVYQDLGVNGFEQLSEKSGGFVKALQALQGAVGNDEQELAKLFNTIRANVGVLNLLTNNTELYEKTAKRSAQSSKELATALEGIKGTAAREAAKNAAELEVIFTRLGDKALDIQNAVTNAFLAFTKLGDEAVIGTTALTAGLIGATVAVTKFGVASKVAFPPVLAFFAVVGTGAALGKGFTALADSVSATAEATAKLEVERMEAFVDSLRELRDLQLTEATDKLENLNTVINKIAVSAKASAKDIVDAFNIDSGNIQATEAALLEAFGDARVRVLDQVEKAIKDIDDEILKGKRAIDGLLTELSDVSFEFRIENLDKAAQASERLSRSAKATAEAFDLASKAGLGEESQFAAREAAKYAVEQSKAALSAARAAGNADQIQKAQAGVQEAITSQIAVERQLIGLRENVSKKQLLDQQQAFEKLSATAKEQVQDVLDARKAIADAAAEGANQGEINKLKENLVKESTEARKALVEAGQAEVLKTFDLEDQIQTAIGQLEAGLAATKLDWTGAIESLRDQLASATDLKAAVEVTLQIADLARDTGNAKLQEAVNASIAEGGLPGDQLENASRRVLEVFKEQKVLADTVNDASAKTQLAADKARLAIAQSVKEAKIFGDNAEVLTQPIADQLAKINMLSEEQLTKLIENLKKAPAAIAENTEGLFAPFTEEQGKFLNDAVNATIEAAEVALQSIEARKLFDPENLAAAEAVLQKISSENLQDLGFEVDSSGFKEVNEALDLITAEAILSEKAVAAIGERGAIAAVRGLREVGVSTDALKTAASNAKSSYQALLDIAREALQVANEAAAVNSSNSSNGLFFGGRPMYRNDGGSGRGQDTIPAMLSPEEFVVNSKSARNFLPELNAINAGNAPSVSGGGGDTNITIGDINVSSSSDVPSQTARDISLALKRELRRGTS